MEHPNGEPPFEISTIGSERNLEKSEWQARFAVIHDRQQQIRCIVDAMDKPWPFLQLTKSLFRAFIHTKHPRKGSRFPTDKDTSFFLGAGTITCTGSTVHVTFGAPDCEGAFGRCAPLDGQLRQQCIDGIRSGMTEKVRGVVLAPA